MPRNTSPWYLCSPSTNEIEKGYSNYLFKWISRNRNLVSKLIYIYKIFIFFLEKAGNFNFMIWVTRQWNHPLFFPRHSALYNPLLLQCLEGDMQITPPVLCWLHLHVQVLFLILFLNHFWEIYMASIKEEPSPTCL